MPAPRKLAFEPGYRERFWHRNVRRDRPVGRLHRAARSLGAGAGRTVGGLAGRRHAGHARQMDTVAARFNEAFTYRWERVIDFLKLHYVLSNTQRHPYWIEHREAASIPERLQELLQLWRARPPSRRDFSRIEEVFPSASWQYILYGMGFRHESAPRASDRPTWPTKPSARPRA
jgi:tryptophan halogenase